MPQFDSLIIFSLTFNLIIVIFFYLYDLQIGDDKDFKKKKGQFLEKIKYNVLKSFSEHYILFCKKIVHEKEDPVSIKILIFVEIFFFKTLYIFSIYYFLKLVSTLILDIGYRVPSVGKRICDFLKKYASPEIFKIFGNSPLHNFYSHSAAAKIASSVHFQKATTMLLTGLGGEHVATKFGVFKAVRHSVKDAINNEKSYFDCEPVDQSLAEKAIDAITHYTG